MPIKVKTSLAKAKETTVKVSAVDSEKLITVLNRLNKSEYWGRYDVTPTASPKFGKDKKVTEVTIKASPAMVLPEWKEYSKTTKKRQAAWDKMMPKLKKYLLNQHALFLEAIAIFAVELKDLDLDKAGFEKLWKAKKTAIATINVDYGDKTSGGYSIGVDLEIIGPDPVETATDIKTPKIVPYTISGKTVEAAADALDKHGNWGEYEAHETEDMQYALDGKLSKITVKAAPTISMPKWKEYSKGTKDQKATWDKMYKALNAHEDNHHDLFVKAVGVFLKGIVDMDMDKPAAKKHWEKNKKAWRDAQHTYDSPGKSDHGRKEGVELDMNADP